MIRIYEDLHEKGSTSAGTILTPASRELCMYAESAGDAEQRVRADVTSGGLPSGRVYQISPWLSNPELVRSVAASTDGSFQRVFLDPSAGLYSELRRIRLPKPHITDDEASERLTCL